MDEITSTATSLRAMPAPSASGGPALERGSTARHQAAALGGVLRPFKARPFGPGLGYGEAPRGTPYKPTLSKMPSETEIHAATRVGGLLEKVGVIRA